MPTINADRINNTCSFIAFSPFSHEAGFVRSALHDCPNFEGHHRFDLQPLTISRSSFPTLKKGIRFSGIATFSPVFGLRPAIPLA